MSDKAQTNRKWTSSDQYRSNWDTIFTSKPTEAQEKTLQNLVDLTQELGLYEPSKDPWHTPDPELLKHMNEQQLREIFEHLPK